MDENEYCRTCLGYSPRSRCVHLSYIITSNKTVSQFVEEFASLPMSNQESFPRYICSKCYEQLIILNDFRELIISSDIQLRKNVFSFTRFGNRTGGSGKDNLPNKNTKLDCDLEDQLDSIKVEDQPSCNRLIMPFNEMLQPKAESEDSLVGEAHSDLDDKGGESDTGVGIEKYAVDSEDIPREDKTCETSHQKRHYISRINPGRKPSKISKNKRKVHEFKCDICKKVLFGRSNRLKQHIIMSHSDIRNFSCESCDKKFKSKQQLVNHTRVHTGEKPYHCKVCKEAFASHQNLFNHNKKHTGNYKSYKCESCEKAYATPGELETHKRLAHTGEKPFLCEVCSCAYSSARSLGLHKRSVHEKTEKCPKCDLMLSSKRIKQHLQKHQDKEDGIRRYTCDKCGKGFFTSHSLKKHQAVHTGKRPYSCEICQKHFSQKSSVDIHMRIHSDVREFCCDVCTKTFKYKQHLQLHLSKNHKDHGENKTLSEDCNNILPANV